MKRLTLLLTITFVESFATILIERGLYFYTNKSLGFTDTENLWLALGFGVAYASGAIVSHFVAGRFSEKGLLVGTIVAQIAAHLALAQWCGNGAAVAALNAMIGLLSGLKWPVIESYVSSGRTPAAQAGIVGYFNLSWAGAVPAALVAAGPLIGWWSPGLFVTAAALNAASLLMVLRLEVRPRHLEADHPERPDARQMVRIRGLLSAARWSMLSSYSLMWMLAALLPGVLSRLDVGVQAATAMSGVLDLFRLGTFAVLWLWTGWHGRAWPLVWVTLGLPVGFFMSLFAPSVTVLLAGEFIFGISAGMTYYAALYYVMVDKNASVSAGGAHEGLIGTGFAIGPVAGLVGHGLAPRLGGLVQGTVVGTGTVIIVCGVCAARALVRMVRATRKGQGGDS